MIGIHLGEPGPALLKHLKIEPGTATIINALYEGLPAHDAGLDEFDVITRIEGRTSASPKELRKAIADAEPGDVLRLRVVHEGESRSVSVVLAAYDREAMSGAKLIGRAQPEGFGNIRILGDGGEMSFEGLKDFDINMPGFDRFLMDEDKRLFEFLPGDGMRVFEFDRGQGGNPDESIEIGRPDDGEGDSGMRRIDRRLERLERLLSELLGDHDED